MCRLRQRIRDAISSPPPSGELTDARLWNASFLSLSTLSAEEEGSISKGCEMLFHQEKNTFPKSLLSLPRREDPDLAPNTSGWKCSWGALRLTYQHPDEGTAFSPVAIWF